jgi:hypothetical protein
MSDTGIALAGAIAAWAAVITAVIVPAGVRWWNRPQAQWHAERIGLDVGLVQFVSFPKRMGLSGPPTYIAGLYNVGDGGAYDIDIVGVGCEAAMFRLEPKDVHGFARRFRDGLVMPSAFLLVAIRVDDAAGDERGLRVEWTQPPTRRNRRHAQGIYLAGDKQFERQPALPAGRYDGLAPTRRPSGGRVRSQAPDQRSTRSDGVPPSGRG